MKSVVHSVFLSYFVHCLIIKLDLIGCYLPLLLLVAFTVFAELRLLLVVSGLLAFIKIVFVTVCAFQVFIL